MADPKATTTGEVTLRAPEPADRDECARICFEAFGAIHDEHRFPRDFPAIEMAAGMVGMLISSPHHWGVVAERDGRILGSNFLDGRDPIRGVGPITVDPHAQNSGVGRTLMEAALEHGAGATGIRLLQDAFHMRSLSLYTSLGFVVKEPVVVVQGTPRSHAPADVEVRALEEGDVAECEELCEQVHGFARTGELRDAIRTFAPLVALRDGRVVAYATSVTFWQMAHGVAEGDEDMEALLLGAAAAVDEPLALLAPLRSQLFRWCLGQGLRLVKPMNLMALGEYQEPRGAWFPSVLY
jgi:predicted N-acetyltransferase YhbS